MKTTQIRVVFYCRTDIPSAGRNEYRKEHVFPCLIETHEVNPIIVRDPSDNLNNIYEFIKIRVSPNETYNINPEIHVTFCKNDHNQSEMLRGVVYANGKEYTVEQYAPFRSLQIEDTCYDNIIVVWCEGGTIFSHKEGG
jgi:hypothetical protein